jgi:hypothetical protein
MTVIRYDANSKHILRVGDNQCCGGETLNVTPEQAAELLTAPYVNVSLVEGEDPVEVQEPVTLDQTGESQIDPSARFGEAHE